MQADEARRSGRWARAAGAVWLALTAVPLLSAPPEPRQERSEGRRLDRLEPRERLQIEPRVQIEPVRAVELLPAGGSPAEAFSGTVIEAVQTRLSRSLPALWRMTVDAESPGGTALDVRYEVFGTDGRPGLLTLAGQRDSYIPVRIEPLGPETRLDPSGLATMEGGVVLWLDLESVSRSGDYGGTLVVTVNRF